MDLRVEQLPRISIKQYGQDYQSLPIRQESYMHRLEINEDGVYQSSIEYNDRNSPLLESAVSTSKQQKYQQKQQQQQQQQQQQSYNNSYISTDQLEMLQPEDSSLHSLIGIYKCSNNAVEFISNFERYLTACLPSYVWIGLMFLLILWGLIHIITGTINLPFCPSRPMIPIFLIVMGVLYILWGMLRMYAFWPRLRADTLSVDLICKAFEGIMIIAILVWLLLGCIWIYGPEQSINFERIYFQPYYCNRFTYWTAFISAILHSMTILLALLFLFCLLCVGLLKDNK